MLEPVENACLQEPLDQLQHAAIADLGSQQAHEFIVGNRVEVSFQIGVHDPRGTLLEQLIHLAHASLQPRPGRKP